MTKKTIGAIVALPLAAFLAVSAFDAATSCGCHDPDRAELLQMWATRAERTWRETGQCPSGEEMMRETGRDPGKQRRIVIICGDVDGGHLVLIDPGGDDTMST